MKPYALYILLSLIACACRTKPEQAFDLLKQNCRCSKVEMVYTKNDDGIGRYTYTLYESAAQDTNRFWYNKEANRLFDTLQANISWFCAMDEKITIQFYYDNKYNFQTWWKCALQFEF